MHFSGSQATLAFNQLREATTSILILALPSFNKSFILETDAGHAGIWPILMQGEDPLHILAINEKNLRLSTYEKEMLAAVEAVKKWKPYLYENYFIVKIDYQSPKYLLEQLMHSILQHKWLTKLPGLDNNGIPFYKVEVRGFNSFSITLAILFLNHDVNN